ncbi:MAG TPA: hypothetical protein VFH51_01490, partial [Myxococcota bacterium]|nr:hypothetical protein [Myxococcota bacterium]
MLVTSDRGSLSCSREAPAGSLERRLFDAAPGAFGALGVITDVELELRRIPANTVMYTKTLRRSSTLSDFVEEFQTLSATNLTAPLLDEGIYAIVHGNPADGCASILGSRRESAERQRRPLPALPLYADWPTLNAVAQGFGNAFPRLANWVTVYSLGAGTEYHNEPESFTFFQNSHDQAHDILARREPIAWALRASRLIDPALPTAHQCWMVPDGQLEAFMRCAGELLAGEYADVLPSVELQDTLRLPRSSALMSPWADGGGFAYTISAAASDKGGARTGRIIAFYRELSRRAASPCGARVHLLKESHCDDALLRSMYSTALPDLRALRQE